MIRYTIFLSKMIKTMMLICLLIRKLDICVRLTIEHTISWKTWIYAHIDCMTKMMIIDFDGIVAISK